MEDLLRSGDIGDGIPVSFYAQPENLQFRVAALKKIKYNKDCPHQPRGGKTVTIEKGT